MTDIGFLVWHIEAMPADAMDLVRLCKQYNVSRLAFKILNGSYHFNVKQGDKPLVDYFDVLWSEGIKVEGWGYHYPDHSDDDQDVADDHNQDPPVEDVQTNVSQKIG